ncbi:MAG TPA: RICIN domain-containing protein [Clostridiaceae bacterium]|nr:RICIN domain-containing protein [Clostridiaceae bacterium]
MVEANSFNETKYRIEHGITNRSVDGVINGVYTLESAMGKGSYVAINPEGKAELSSAKAERFKFTYKGSRTNQFADCMMLYTIQTMDGKYLALSGNVPTNGKRLITQDTEYLWAIDGPYAAGDGSFKIYPPDFPNLYVNAEGEKSKDGTPIIVWFEVQASPPEHCGFRIYYEGSASTSFSRWKSMPATATPSQTKFVMNGKPISITAAYNINGSNYLQLRAIAAMLNGTAAQFDVIWDGQYAVIEPGKPYSGTITEARLQSTTNVHISDTKFKMNGEVFTFSDARLIDGGTNYIQLREFAQKLSGTASQFNVYWDSEAKQAVIQPGVAYTGEAPEADPSTDTITGSDKLEDGIYYIKASKDKNFAIDVPNSSKEDGAKLIIFQKTGNDNQKFRITNVSGNKYKIQCVHSGKWWNSSGTKGAIITQSDSAAIFTITEQADGTYRIMDSSTGLYAGISGAIMKNGTNIILWTEASDASQTYIFEKIK